MAAPSLERDVETLLLLAELELAHIFANTWTATHTYKETHRNTDTLCTWWCRVAILMGCPHHLSRSSKCLYSHSTFFSPLLSYASYRPIRRGKIKIKFLPRHPKACIYRTIQTMCIYTFVYVLPIGAAAQVARTSYCCYGIRSLAKYTQTHTHTSTNSYTQLRKDSPWIFFPALK